MNIISPRRISMVRCLLAAVVSALLASTAGVARAQSTTPAVSVAAPVGPTLGAARLAADVPTAALAAEERLEPRNALRNGPGFGQAETLMIVGGAAFLAGALIGGDAGTIVMVGGAGIGLYGLYLYLQ
jgi:hypothetical protein